MKGYSRLLRGHAAKQRRVLTPAHLDRRVDDILACSTRCQEVVARLFELAFDFRSRELSAHYFPLACVEHASEAQKEGAFEKRVGDLLACNARCQKVVARLFELAFDFRNSYYCPFFCRPINSYFTKKKFAAPSALYE